MKNFESLEQWRQHFKKISTHYLVPIVPLKHGPVLLIACERVATAITKTKNDRLIGADDIQCLDLQELFGSLARLIK